MERDPFFFEAHGIAWLFPAVSDPSNPWGQAELSGHGVSQSQGSSCTKVLAAEVTPRKSVACGDLCEVEIGKLFSIQRPRGIATAASLTRLTAPKPANLGSQSSKEVLATCHQIALIEYGCSFLNQLRPFTFLRHSHAYLYFSIYIYICATVCILLFTHICKYTVHFYKDSEKTESFLTPFGCIMENHHGGLGNPGSYI